MIRSTPRSNSTSAEIQEASLRASGPGGQNVNKVSTGRATALRRRPFPLAARAGACPPDGPRGPPPHPGGVADSSKRAVSEPAAQPRRCAGTADRTDSRSLRSGDAAPPTAPRWRQRNGAWTASSGGGRPRNCVDRNPKQSIDRIKAAAPVVCFISTSRRPFAARQP